VCELIGGRETYQGEVLTLDTEVLESPFIEQIHRELTSATRLNAYRVPLAAIYSVIRTRLQVAGHSSYYTRVLRQDTSHSRRLAYARTPEVMLTIHLTAGRRHQMPENGPSSVQKKRKPSVAGKGHAAI
jgi:hypothetical protein